MCSTICRTGGSRCSSGPAPFAALGASSAGYLCPSTRFCAPTVDRLASYGGRSHVTMGTVHRSWLHAVFDHVEGHQGLLGKYSGPGPDPSPGPGRSGVRDLRPFLLVDGLDRIPLA